MTRIAQYVGLIILSVTVVGCARKDKGAPKQDDKTHTADLPRVVSRVGNGRLSFALKTVSQKGDVHLWSATFAKGGSVARFNIELRLTKPKGKTPFSFSKGAFHRLPGSDGKALIRGLVQALQATTAPRGGARLDKLPFSVAILGINLYRGKGEDAIAGGFTSTNKGGWIATKVFLAGGEAEVYLNLNPSAGVGEFAIKDTEYGNKVVAELAKVFH